VKVGDVRYLKPKQYITIREGKTGKKTVLAVNKKVQKALKHYLDSLKP